MRQHAVSQLPVLEEGRLVGLLGESDLLLAATESKGAFKHAVRTCMTTKLRTLPLNARIEDVLAILGEGFVAIVVDGDELHGLVTRIDVLSYLRRQEKAVREKS